MKIFNHIFQVATCVLLSAALFTSCQDETLLSAQTDQVNTAQTEDLPWQPGTAIFKLKNSPTVTTRAASDVVTRAKVFDNADVKVEQIFDMTSEYADLKRKMGLDRWFVVKFDKNKNVGEVLNELRNDPAVEKANGDIVVIPNEVKYTPATAMNGTRARLTQDRMWDTNDGQGPLNFTDPYLKYQWHYMTTIESYNYFKPGADINLFPAWQKETGDPNVVVAIIDSGVDFEHEDLKGSAWEGKDKDGKTINGRNFYYLSSGKGDINEIIPGGHGTHVAGTIAARNNNATGVSGIAGGNGTSNSGVRLMSCEIYGHDGKQETANVQSIVKAFEFAQEHGALIANCSWGYEFDRTKHLNNEYFQNEFKEIFELLKGGIDYFTQYAGCDKSGNKKPDSYMKGGLVFFASGNDGQKDIDMIPASYDKVVAVGAFDGMNVPTDYMDKGPWVDILAPGGTTQEGQVQRGILSTVPKAYHTLTTGTYPNTDFVLPWSNDYAFAQGTSMAAPHVTGIAALVISKLGKAGKEELTNEKLRKHLLASVKPISPYVMNPDESVKGKLGVGFIDADYALSDPETQAPEKPVVTAVKYEGEELKGYYDGKIKWNVTADNDALNNEKTAFAFDINLYEKSNLSKPVKSVTVYTYEKAVDAEMEYEFVQLKTGVEYVAKVVARDRFDNKSDEATCEFTTRPNREPKFTVTLPEDLKLSDTEPFYHIVMPVVDEDKHTWTHTNTQLPNGVELKRIGDSFDLLIKIGLPGKFAFNVTLTDQLGGQATQHFSYEVVSHKAPALANPLTDVSLREQGEAAVIDLTNVFEAAAQGSNMQYTVKSNDETIVQAGIEGTQLKLTPGKAGFATITLTAGNGGKNTVTTFQVRVSAKNSSDTYALYPIPAHSYIKMLMRSDVREVQAIVTSVRGQKVIDQKLEVSAATHEATLGVDRLVPGTYYLLLKTERFTSKHTFIKK